MCKAHLRQKKQAMLSLVFSLYIINIYLTQVAVWSKQIFSNVYAPKKKSLKMFAKYIIVMVFLPSSDILTSCASMFYTFLKTPVRTSYSEKAALLKALHGCIRVPLGIGPHLQCRTTPVKACTEWQDGLPDHQRKAFTQLSTILSRTSRGARIRFLLVSTTWPFRIISSRIMCTLSKLNIIWARGWRRTAFNMDRCVFVP